jgi:hypothetical protein
MKNANPISRNDPEYMICGTLFSYQKALDTFVERDVPSNKIMMAGIWEDNTWTQFFFDSRTKNIYRGGFPDGKRPGHVHLVLLPSLPYCERLGIHVKTYQEKQAEIKNEQERALKSLTQHQRIHKKGRRI